VGGGPAAGFLALTARTVEAEDKFIEVSYGSPAKNKKTRVYHGFCQVGLLAGLKSWKEILTERVGDRKERREWGGWWVEPVSSQGARWR